MFIPGIINASTYPAFSQESTGGPKFPDFANINEVLTQSQPNRIMKLGQYIVDGFGNIAEYITAAAAVAQGKVLMKAATTTSTASTADATGDNIHVIKTAFAGPFVKNELADRYLWIDGKGIYVILGNSATNGGVTYITVSQKDTRFARGGYDGNAIAVAVTNTTKLAIIRQFHVDICVVSGATCLPVGVGVGTITSGQGGLMLVQGIGQVQADLAGVALVDGGAMVVSGTAAGTVVGPTAAPTGTLAALETRSLVGTAQFAYTPAASGQLIPGLVNLFGRL